MSVYNIGNLPDTAVRFVFDTNVLLFLHGFNFENRDQNVVRNMREYSVIANNIIADCGRVYIDLIALSEFVNKYINRALADKLRVPYKNFRFDKREHRTTPEYSEVIEDLQQVINQIMNSYNVEVVSDGYDQFDASKISEILPVMELNDHLISLVAKKYNACLVTHDRDIVEGCRDINVLTALPVR